MWQVRHATASVLGAVWGNPHTQGPASRRTLAAIARVRERVLDHFGVDAEQYHVVFTSGATAALKLVAEVRGRLPPAACHHTHAVTGAALSCAAGVRVRGWLPVRVLGRQPHQRDWHA